MSIRQHGETFMMDVTVNKQRHRMIFGTRAEAEEAERKLTTQIIANGKPVWTMRHVADLQFTLWRGKGGERNAVRNAEYAVDFFGASTPIADVTTEWIDAYIARLQQLGNSGSTINRKLAALSSLLSYAYKRGNLEKKPHLERQAEGEGRIRYLTKEEEDTVLQVLGQWGKDDHAEATQVLIDTGMRPSELWLLEPRDCEETTGLLSLWRVKNHKPRSVPATRRVREIIARRKEFTIRGQRLFPFGNDWMLNVWDRVKLHIGLKNDSQFVPYALRHTCASRLVQRGVDLLVVRDWMGHKNIQQTLRYAHLAPKNLTDAAKVLEDC